MMDFISIAVEHPAFIFLFFLGLLSLGAGIIIRFGFHSVKAISNGAYDVWTLIFILFLSLFCHGAESKIDVPLNFFSTIMPDVLSPIIDFFSMEDGFRSGFWIFIYYAAKLFFLAFFIEIMHSVFHIFQKKKGLTLWWLSETTTAVLTAFLYGIAIKWWEAYVPENLRLIIVNTIFVIVIISLFVVALLNILLPNGWDIFLDFYMKIIATPLFTTLITVLLFAIADVSGLLGSIKSFNAKFLNNMTPEAVLSIIGLILLLFFLWYVVYLILRRD